MVEGDRILDVVRNAEVPKRARVIDAAGMYLVPGFIDIHTHGGGGAMVMDGTPEAITAMCNAHAMHGTTTLVPTTAGGPVSAIERAIDSVRKAQGSKCRATIAGIHLQGPFFARAQTPAHLQDSLLLPDAAGWEPLLDRWNGIRMVGAAPELSGGLALGDALTSRGIIASISHSDADYAHVQAAVAHGYSDVTNLYVDTSSLMERGDAHVPGVSECGLVMDELNVQVAADGWQLPLVLLQLIYRCKGAEGIVLVTDACGYRSPSARFDEGFATMALLVRNMVSAGVSLRIALRMATVNPARRIGLEDRKGRIAAGYDADLLLLDSALNVRLCMAKGRILRNELKDELPLIE